MNYELAKQLKDAGFPQTPIFSKEAPHGHYVEGDIDSDEGGIVSTNSAYVPSLEELVEGCGKWIDLYGSKNAWYSSQYTALDNKEIFAGSTPAEAVAKLWLALNPETKLHGSN